jgi:hypothetical protein
MNAADFPQTTAIPFKQCIFLKIGKEFANQHYWHCETCDLVENLGCCDACATSHHFGHKLINVGARGFYCDCGFGEKELQCKCIGLSPLPPNLPSEHVPLFE